MAELTQIDVKTMDYSYLGEPFIWFSVDSTTNFYTMDYSYLGEPLVINSAAIVSYNIKSIGGVLLTNIKSLNGVLIANIKSVGGVSKL